MPPADSTGWIDCGRYGYLPGEQTPPHWLTLPRGSSGVLVANPPAPLLQEIPLDKFLAGFHDDLTDPITTRTSARLTDRLSLGASTRFTQMDDTPPLNRPWPVIAITSTDDFTRLLESHDAAWTSFEKSGAALVLNIEPPPGTSDLFGWLPVVDRFFARHTTLPILLDGMGPTEVKGWDQLVKLGADARVYGLARGIPGLAPDRRDLPFEQLTATELRRADAILHFYVGEAGAERVLFGSGLGRKLPVDEGRIHAQALWFASDREWLDPDSATFILQGNAQRLMNANR